MFLLCIIWLLYPMYMFKNNYSEPTRNRFTITVKPCLKMKFPNVSSLFQSNCIVYADINCRIDMDSHIFMTLDGPKTNKNIFYFSSGSHIKLGNIAIYPFLQKNYTLWMVWTKFLNFFGVKIKTYFIGLLWRHKINRLKVVLRVGLKIPMKYWAGTRASKGQIARNGQIGWNRQNG